MNAQAQPAHCPKCRTVMIHVAVTPHPVVTNMHRNTFVCYGCNQTRTYMLPAAEPLAAPVVAAPANAAPAGTAPAGVGR